MKNTKKKILNIFEIVSIFFLLLGASYAYFKAQREAGPTSNVELDAGKVDLLTFNKGKNIDIELNQENLRPGMDDIKDETSVRAILQANSGDGSKGNLYRVGL